VRKFSGYDGHLVPQDVELEPFDCPAGGDAEFDVEATA
jgi:hypothetical protein